MNYSEFLLKKHTTITGKKFKDMSRCFIYIWKRDEEFLYIGLSKNGFGRFSHHHVLGEVDDVKNTDTIELYYAPSGESDRAIYRRMLNEEERLIKKYHPKYNKGHRIGIRNRVKCVVCRRNFYPIISEQNWCSKKCQIAFQKIDIEVAKIDH